MSFAADLVEKERAELAPSHREWKWLQDASKTVNKNEILELVVVVVENRKMIEQIVSEISNPKSPNYGKHLSKEEIKGIAMMPEEKDAVVKWLRGINGATINESRGSSGNHIAVKASVAVWNAALNADFQYYQKHPNGEEDTQQQQILRCAAYSLPSHISDFVQTIHGTVQVCKG